MCESSMKIPVPKSYKKYQILFWLKAFDLIISGHIVKHVMCNFTLQNVEEIIKENTLQKRIKSRNLHS